MQAFLISSSRAGLAKVSAVIRSSSGIIVNQIVHHVNAFHERIQVQKPRFKNYDDHRTGINERGGDQLFTTFGPTNNITVNPYFLKNDHPLSMFTRSLFLNGHSIATYAIIHGGWAFQRILSPIPCLSFLPPTTIASEGSLVYEALKKNEALCERIEELEDLAQDLTNFIERLRDEKHQLSLSLAHHQ